MTLDKAQDTALHIRDCLAIFNGRLTTTGVAAAVYLRRSGQFASVSASQTALRIAPKAKSLPTVLPSGAALLL